ncbi:MAG: exodeoxyribonuclease VII large subunit [Candidatus Moraniibacteriota bacterium]
MNQAILKKLKSWRQQKADLENCELFRVFQNKTLEDIATILPNTKDDLFTIKGIKEKKFEKYGRDILDIINECTDSSERIEIEGETESVLIQKREQKVYSVSDFLNLVNSSLRHINIAVRGEVSSVKLQNHLYFSLKDKTDGSVVNCFMWANDYEMCGVKMQEGMEITIHGFPEVYKPGGKLNFRTSVIELVGEGALKKAYDELKDKLEAEGLFAEERKKQLPDFSQKIGLITSRNGAVINDFMSNIGRFGYHITFVDSRVEGITAVKDLITAVQYFKDKSIDVLVIIRGGGSLESLQAFNNEALIREIVKMPMPVLCGIGHDKDVPLLSYVADKAVSTPSIVAKEINKSWERAVDKLDYYETTIISKYEGTLRDSKYKLENASIQMRDFYENIFRKFEQYQQAIENFIANINQTIRHEKYKIQKLGELLATSFSRNLESVKDELDNFEKELHQNNPERQLKLGYSIVTLNGRVVKSASQIKKGDILVSKLGEGKVQSEAQEIFNN